jgi:hypothetical protein
MLVDWWLRALCSVVVALSALGCSFSRYRYISLEGQPGVEIENYETPTLKRLYFSSKMPIQYSLDRKDYRLEFRTNLDSYLPEMWIAVRGHDGEQLRMLQRASRRGRRDRAVSCGSFGAVDNGAPNEIRFSWVTCAHAGRDERYISFDVTSEAGSFVGMEDVPFELKTNGYYVLPDLL